MCPSPQNPYRKVSTNSMPGLPLNSAAKKSYQLSECLLEERMIKARLIARILILDKSRCRLLFLFVGNQFNSRYFVEHKIRQRWLVLVVGSAHLNAKSNAFVVLLRKIEDELHVIGQLEAPRPRLHLSPSRAYVKLLPQGKSDQVLDGLVNVVRFNFLCATIGRDVCDQSLAIIRHNFF